MNKISTASFWTLAGFIFSQLVRLLGNLVLTRLLLPEMFALMAIVTSVRVGVYMCSEIGLKMSVIRHENGETPAFLQTAWTMQVIRGGLLWIFISIFAVSIKFIGEAGFFPLASVYSDERLPLLLAVIGLVSFIVGFESSKIWLAQRNLNLGRVTVLELVAQTIGAVVMVYWAWKSPSVWALVFGSIISALCRVIMSHLFLRGARDAFRLDKEVVLEIFKFGKWLFISAIITFFALNGDRLILGGFLTTEQLGVYSVAFFLATAVRDLLLSLTSKVYYPLLSDANRNTPEKLQKKYYDIKLWQDMTVFFVIGFLYCTAPLIVQLLYDDRYENAGWMMQILVISLISSVFNIGNSLLMALGYSHYGTVLVTMKAVTLWVGVPLLYSIYGIAGAVWGVTISSFVSPPFIMFFLHRKKILIFYKELWMIVFIPIGYIAGDFFILIKDFLFLGY
mgnify:CR=1 FL=1